MRCVALWLCLSAVFGRPTATFGAPVEILANGGLDPPHVAINSSNANGIASGLIPSGWSDNSLFAGNHTETVYAEDTNGTVGGSAAMVTATPTQTDEAAHVLNHHPHLSRLRYSRLSLSRTTSVLAVVASTS